MPKIGDPNDAPLKKPPIAAPDTDHLSDKPQQIEEDDSEDEDLDEFMDDDEDDDEDEDEDDDDTDKK